MPAFLIALYDEPADPAAFDAYYESHHVAPARSIAGIQEIQISEGPAMAFDGSQVYHRAGMIRFASMAELQAGLVSPEGQATAADLANFASGGVTLFVFEARDVTSG